MSESGDKWPLRCRYEMGWPSVTPPIIPCFCREVTPLGNGWRWVYNADMGRWVHYLLSVGLLMFGCGKDDKTTSSSMDLVGKPAVSSGERSPRSSNEDEGARETGGVDLIHDWLFRYRRDGWTLKTDNADVNVSKLNKSGLSLVLSAIGNPSNVQQLMDDMATIRDLVNETKGALVLSTRLKDALAMERSGKIAVMILLEGADALVGADEKALLTMKRNGLMAVGLVADRSNQLADASQTPEDGSQGGLTKEGRRLVVALHHMGIAVDLTHASKRAFYDVLVQQRIPAMVSHSAAAALRSHPRNLDDLQLLTLARSGGVMGVVFNPEFLTRGNDGTTIDDVVRHMVHVRRIGALSALSLGTDYDGVIPPSGLDDVSFLPRLKSRLLSEGFSREDVNQIWSGNATRYLEYVDERLCTDKTAQREVLRPLSLDCETVTGEFSGNPVRGCDGFVLDDAVTLTSSARYRLRIENPTRTPVRIELFGVPNTPWQVEGQTLDGTAVVKRSLLLDDRGRGAVGLPEQSGLVRVFVSPTRESVLKEAVIWGR